MYCISFPMLSFLPPLIGGRSALDIAEGKRASREVQLPETWEQNQGKCEGEQRRYPGLWPQSRAVFLWKKRSGVSSTPFATSASVKVSIRRL